MPDSSPIMPDFPSAVADLAERFRDALSEEPAGEEQLGDLVRVLRGKLETRKEGLSTLAYLKARAIFETIDDVLRLFWEFSMSTPDQTEDSDGEPQIIVHPPDLTDTDSHTVDELKARTQEAITTARDEQLQEERTRALIKEMERKRAHPSENGTVRSVSVQDLFLSPQTLAKDLREFQSAEPPEKLAQVQTLVDPYLQFVDSSENDDYTGLRLLDIWRYARYTWSIPLKQTPGRRMRYLIRDRSRDFHPIIGIGALGSGVMQLTPRDQEVGWAPLALAHTKRLKEHFAGSGHHYTKRRARVYRGADFRRVFGTDTRQVIDAMLGQLQTAVEYLYLDDFYNEGVLSPGEVQSPSVETVERLEGKKQQIKNAQSNHDISDTGNLEEDAQSSLYSRKRATALKRILKAKRILIAFSKDHRSCNDAQLRERLVERAEVRKAFKTALRTVKKRRIAGLMDITTCGALPPYNEILGGKLVSFLMASPQVIRDYRERYENQESVIASRMKGKTVVRRPELVLLSTTSLYAAGSSQYNRLNAPTANGNLEYQHIGESSGYGHIHISQRTFGTLVELLEEVARQNEEYDRPGNRFGNGVNYRMRTISAALARVGLRPLDQHEQPRLIYLIPLAENWRDYLTGKEVTPEYIYEDTEQDPYPETKALIDFWKIRWLYKRAQKEKIIQRLEEAKGKVRVSDLIPDEDAASPAALPFEEQAA